MDKHTIANHFKEVQEYICQQLEKTDGLASFKSDSWERKEGGGGRTNTLSNGALIEKGGVAFSEVFGDISNEMKRQLNFTEGNTFFATGVSIVLHPNNPHVPIIHMNIRYFEMDNGMYWFGGGIDLTPHFVIPENAAVFHQRLKAICDKYDAGFYPTFKQQADTYFFIPHREETRGVGGVFYDHLTTENTKLSKEQLIQFALDLGNSFPHIYAEQASFGRNLTFDESDLRWRNLRRGRYAEFNLVNDRGTKFGLFSSGRTESILMSLPPDASWEYMHPYSEKEQATLDCLKKGIDWLV
jgi:coproporphyrinogen III oxidase